MWLSGSGTPSGELSLAVFLPAVIFYVGSLPAYRVLMVWVYDRTGSLLVAMLMHASFSASMLILQPLELDMVAGLGWNLLLAATLWAVVAAVAIPKGRQLSAPEASGLRRAVPARVGWQVESTHVTKAFAGLGNTVIAVLCRH